MSRHETFRKRYQEPHARVTQVCHSVQTGDLYSHKTSSESEGYWCFIPFAKCEKDLALRRPLVVDKHLAYRTAQSEAQPENIESLHFALFSSCGWMQLLLRA
jgi:hypothetical protein